MATRKSRKAGSVSNEAPDLEGAPEAPEAPVEESPSPVAAPKKRRNLTRERLAAELDKEAAEKMVK